MFQVRECAEAMEAAMQNKFQTDDKVWDFEDKLHNGNPLPIARMACVLDPRTKSCVCAYEHKMEP